MEEFTWAKYLNRPLSRLWCKFSDERRLETHIHTDHNEDKPVFEKTPVQIVV